MAPEVAPLVVIVKLVMEALPTSFWLPTRRTALGELVTQSANESREVRGTVLGLREVITKSGDRGPRFSKNLRVLGHGDSVGDHVYTSIYKQNLAAIRNSVESSLDSFGVV